MYLGKNKIDRYIDRHVENIKETDTIKCYKCTKDYFPSGQDISIKRPSVYYLTCVSCRAINELSRIKCKNKVSYVSNEST